MMGKKMETPIQSRLPWSGHKSTRHLLCNSVRQLLGVLGVSCAAVKGLGVYGLRV